MSWDLDGGGGSKTEFTTFPVGVTRIRVLSDAPHMRWTHWMPQFRRSVTCPGNCPIDKMRKEQKAAGLPQTYNMSRSFAMNVYNHETNRYEIMEQGKTFMEDLRDVMEDLKEQGKKLSDVILKVRRRGTGKDDTSYRIDVDVEETLSIAEDDAMTNMKDLTEYYKPHTVEQINALLAVVANTPDEYKEAWNNIMNPQGEEAADEDIEVATGE